MRIGVCIPCHVSHIKYLPKCLESIENQTHQPEVVSISISETDQPPELPIYSFEVKITISQDHQCEGKNRNIAASLITSDIITFFDADDIMHPQRLEIIHKAFNEQNIDGFIHANKLCASSQYRTRSITKIPWEQTSSKIYTDCFSTSKDHICGRVTSIHGGSTNGHFSIKRSVLETHPYPINYGVGVDSEYVYKFHHGGYKLGYCPDKLSYYVRDDFPIDNDLIIYDSFKLHTSPNRPPLYCKYSNTEINNVIEFLLSIKSPERAYPIYIIDQVHEFTESDSKKILYNIEQMTRSDMFNRNSHRMSRPDIVEIWDYSITNYNILKNHGFNIHHVPFKLSIDKIISYSNLISDNKIYDIAFCGQVGPYRQKILDELKEKNKKVLILENDYTESKDPEIGKAKLLINIHFNESYKVFESIRCEPWLSCGFPVLSESSLDDDPRAITTPYSNLVEKACEMLNDIKNEKTNINDKVIFYCDTELRNPKEYHLYESGRDLFIVNNAVNCTSKGYNVTVYGRSLISKYNNITFKNPKTFDPTDEIGILVLFPPFSQDFISKLTNTTNIFIYMDILHDLPSLAPNVKQVFFNSKYTRNHYKILDDNNSSVIYSHLSNSSNTEKNRYKILCTMPYDDELFYLLYEVWPVIKGIIPEAEIHIVSDSSKLSEGHRAFINVIMKAPGIIERGLISEEELLYEKKTSLIHINISNNPESLTSIETSIELGCIPIVTDKYNKMCGIHIYDHISTEKAKNKIRDLLISLLQSSDIILDTYRTFLLSTFPYYNNKTLIDKIQEIIE